MQLYHVGSATAAGKEGRFRRLFRADGRSVMVAMELAKLHDSVHGDGEP